MEHTEVTEPRQEQAYTERRLFSYEERLAILKSTGGICACCGTKLTTKTMTVEHIISIHQKGTNDPENLTALCEECNKRKDHATYIPESFYIALAGSSRIRSMNRMVRNWYQNISAYETNLETNPMIAPEHYTLMMTGQMRKPVFATQLLYKWEVIRKENLEEMEAVTQTDISLVKKFLSRAMSKEKAEDMYGVVQDHAYYQPVAIYVLKKASTDKYIAAVAIRYDKTIKDMIVDLFWTDTKISKWGIAQVLTMCLSRVFYAIVDIADKDVDQFILISEGYGHAFDYFNYLDAQKPFGYRREDASYVDGVTGKRLDTISISRKRFEKAKPLKDYIPIPKWLTPIP